MRVAFLGTPAFAVPSLERLVAAGHDVVLVVTQPDRPAGRGRELQPPPVKLVAERLGLELFQRDNGVVSGGGGGSARGGVQAGADEAPARGDRVVLAQASGDEVQAGAGGVQAGDDARSGDVLTERLRVGGIELGVVAAFGEILGRETLAVPSRGFLNVHPSLLPRLRGATPVPSAILEGTTDTGVTIMQVNTGVDAGPIMAQVGEAIGDEDTGETLLGRLAELGADLLVETIDRWERGQIVPRRQEHRLATYSRQLRREDGVADFGQPAVELWRRCRAFQPWPGFYTTWQGRVLKLLDVTPLPSRQGHTPGTVFKTSAGLAVACGTGALLLRRLQAEGRRAMTIDELVRGQPAFRGARLGPRGG